MSAISGAVDWAGKHPVMLGVGVFAVGAVVLLMMRGGGSSGDNGMGAFYAAQAAQAASGNQLAAVQEQVKGATALAGIQADQNVRIATVSSQTSLGIAQANADVATMAEKTRQQAQKQQFFLNVGQQQIEAQAMPFFLAQFNQGGDTAAAALASWLHLSDSVNDYSPAH